MEDMKPEDIVGEYSTHQHTFFDGTSRQLLVTDTEIPFPEGKLIVSRTDTKGIITHINQAFVDMSGFTEAELIGQPQCILRHPDMPPAAYQSLWETVQSGKKWQGYVKNLRKDGAYYWVYAVVIPNVRDGKIIGYSSVRRKPSPEKIAECIETYPTLF